MGCFCRISLESLAESLRFSEAGHAMSAGAMKMGAGLGVGTATKAAGGLSAEVPGIAVSLPALLPPLSALALKASAVADWLACRGIPGPFWRPEPHWVDLRLPKPGLAGDAGAAILVLAQARMAILDTLGIDLMHPAHTTAMSRVIATLNARADALMDLRLGLGDPQRWVRLATLAVKIKALRAVLAAGFMPRPGVRVAAAYLEPAGIRLDDWAPLVESVHALLPSVLIAAQLGVDLTAPSAVVEIAAAIRALATVRLPIFTQAIPVASITLTLCALVQLRDAIGIDPVRVGFPEAEARVFAALDEISAMLPSELPVMPPAANQFITADLIMLMRRIDPVVLSQMRWTPPPILSLAAVTSALPVARFAAVAKLWTGSAAIRAAPCDAACDAARAMKAAAAPPVG